jgi:replicative DNA helicase
MIDSQATGFNISSQYDFVHGAGLFASYGKPFQEKVLQGLLNDHAYASQMYEVMKPDFFDVKYLEYLAQVYFTYYAKYKCFPSMSSIITILKDDLRDGNDIILRDQIVNYLHQIKANPNINDMEFVKDKSLDFCKRQAMRHALERAVGLIDDEKFESVVGLMKTAVSIGIPHTPGHVFFDDVEARFMKIDRNVIPTGLPALDEKNILNGGLGRGELGVVVGSTGTGKSHWLVQMGTAAMLAGKNVLHYTFELTEHAVGLRYDANLCDISVSDIHEHKDLVKNKYNSHNMGKLIIKEYPTGSATVLMLKNHIEKLYMKGFKPNLIIIDYADIMRSSRSFDSLRHELKLVYEELRNLAMELSVPIWTASQANRDASNSDVVGLENMSEAYGKAMVADFIVSISRKPEEKASGSARLFVAKNRAGRDGVVFPLTIDTSKSKFTILNSDSISLQDANQQIEKETKGYLREKWKEVKNSVAEFPLI